MQFSYGGWQQKLFILNNCSTASTMKKRYKWPNSAFNNFCIISASDDNSILYKLKRRFLKDQEQSRVYFARKQNRLKDMREVRCITCQTWKWRQRWYQKYNTPFDQTVVYKYMYLLGTNFRFVCIKITNLDTL